MQRLERALKAGLAKALTDRGGDGEGMLSKDQLISMTRGQIEASCADALLAEGFVDVLSTPGLMDQLLLDLARDNLTVQGALYRGANVDVRDGDGSTALILCCRSGRGIENVRHLLRYGADVHLAGTACGTALHAAAAAEDEEAIVLLLDAGADPYHRSSGVRDEKIEGRDALTILEAHHMEDFLHFAHYREAFERRKVKAARYVSGQLGASVCTMPWAEGGGPAFYRGRPWSETSHRYCPPVFREVVRTLLLASRRRSPGEVCCLPAELWTKVFRNFDRDWFQDPASRKRQEPQGGSMDAHITMMMRAIESRECSTEEAIMRFLAQHRPNQMQQAQQQPEAETEVDGATAASEIDERDFGERIKDAGLDEVDRLIAENERSQRELQERLDQLSTD
jgi:hypothetical protein